MLVSAAGWVARQFVIHPFLATSLTCSVIFFIYASYWAIYNKYCHPLSKIPGPYFAGVTDFFHLYLFSTKQNHKKVYELHKHYGPFVRVAPNVVSFNDPTLLPLVYHKHAEKTPFYSTGMAGEEAPLLQTEDDSEHAEKMRILGPTYSVRHMKIMEEIVSDRIVCTMDQFRQKAAAGKIVDMAEWARWHVYDTITHLIYGEPVGMTIEGRDVNGLVAQWHKIFTLGGLVATLPWLIHPIISIKWLGLMPSKSHKFGAGHIMNAHEQLFKRRLHKPELAKDGNMFDSLLHTTHTDGRQFTLEEAEHQCFILTVGSQDTSAAFISAFLHYILTHEQAYRRLVEEIDAFDRSGRLSQPVTYEETEHMPYFLACVKEALRLSPSVSMILPRYAPEGGMYLGDTWVPESVEVAANPYVIHRDRGIYGEDAEEFRPERWMEHPAKIQLMKKYFLAFGYGSRRCLGKNIALFESQKFIIQLLRDFTLRIKDPKKPFRTENWGIIVHWEQDMILQSRQKGDEPKTLGFDTMNEKTKV